jgi:hypothetical protein
LAKKIPTYNYVIPPDFDLDFSENNNLIYISGIDPSYPA